MDLHKRIALRTVLMLLAMTGLLIGSSSRATDRPGSGNIPETIMALTNISLGDVSVPGIYAPTRELIPFGDFEQWVTREINESAIIGGKTQRIYNIGPSETIRGNVPYDYGKTIWGTSNAFAKVVGVVKTSVTVEPDCGPSGTCCRLTTRFASCRVLGLVDIKVLAAGAIYWGKVFEPITGVNDPYAFMDWGIPFTGRPKALVLDLRALIPNTGRLVKGTTFKSTYFNGDDPAEVLLILQHRTEAKDGSIHALRVGTAWCRIDHSTDGWEIDCRIPVIYGDAREDAGYKPFMNLVTGQVSFYAVNSRGKNVPIIEDGWAPADAIPTHAILKISSGSHEAFIGALDNTLWVDNLRLEY